MRREKDSKGFTEAEYLASYKNDVYGKISVAVDILLLRMKEDLSCMQTLLIQRKAHPFLDCWALPGGFLGEEESAYEAACRKLREKTGIEGIYLEQLYSMNQPERDPRMRIIDIAFTGLIPYSEHREAKSEDAAWFDITHTGEQIALHNEERDVHIVYELQEKAFPNGIITVRNYVPRPVSEEILAFDHSEIVLEGLMKLRNNVLLSDCAFNLVPNEFTLPDLQKVYEVILGSELYKANFRDKMAGKIVAKNKLMKPLSGNRVANVYSYKLIE